MVLQEQIVNAEQTLQKLSLQRQLAEIREERREANDYHQDLVNHCAHQMSEATHRCRSILQELYQLSDYMSIVADQYTASPGNYVLRKHSQLLMIIRSNHILDNYHRLAMQHHEKIVEDLEDTIQDLRQDLRELKNQREEQTYLIQEQTVMLMTSRIMLYYDEKNKANHGEANARQSSVLQKLVSRKASQRLLIVC